MMMMMRMMMNDDDDDDDDEEEEEEEEDDDEGEEDDDDETFKDFAKVDGSVLLWHPICNSSSIKLIFIFILCSACESKRNFRHKFLKHENC